MATDMAYRPLAPRATDAPPGSPEAERVDVLYRGMPAHLALARFAALGGTVLLPTRTLPAVHAIDVVPIADFHAVAAREMTHRRPMIGIVVTKRPQEATAPIAWPYGLQDRLLLELENWTPSDPRCGLPALAALVRTYFGQHPHLIVSAEPHDYAYAAACGLALAAHSGRPMNPDVLEEANLSCMELLRAHLANAAPWPDLR